MLFFFMSFLPRASYCSADNKDYISNSIPCLVNTSEFLGAEGEVFSLSHAMVLLHVRGEGRGIIACSVWFYRVILVATAHT